MSVFVSGLSVCMSLCIRLCAGPRVSWAASVTVRLPVSTSAHPYRCVRVVRPGGRVPARVFVSELTCVGLPVCLQMCAGVQRCL